MNDQQHTIKKVEGTIILRSVFYLVLLIVITFIIAGRINYWQGWIFNGINVLFLVLSYLLLPSELIRERVKPEKGMKRWDKIYYIISTPLFFAILIVSVLDGGRFNWEPRISFFTMIVGIVVFIIGQILVLWAKKVNRFFSSVVRIQKERGQTVCKDGPYRLVRHPGYLGGLLYTIVTPLVLGSLWGLIPAVIALVVVFVRTRLEDETLRRELAGYTEYAGEIRYRLLPGIW